MRRPVLAAVIVVLLAASTAAFRGVGRTVAERPAGAALPVGGEPAHLDPAELSARIDHPYWPMRPGSLYRLAGAGGGRRIEVTVMDRTRTVMGAQARVVHDVETRDGQVIEDTYDWYAQDAAGNVWYLGEDARRLEGGRVTSTEGSWEAGVDGAQPGLLLPARPRPGMAYRQEHGAGARDAAAVLSLHQRAKVPSGLFEQVLVTEESTPLEPGRLEHDFFALGVGPVLTLTVAGGADREELLRFEPAPP